MFEIEKTLSFNADKLVEGDDYDYVTRTSLNQGVLQGTGFINEKNINQPGTFSLGLLQMDFFYRKKPWYAGQFVRKIIPQFDLNEKSALYFSALLNKQKQKLLSVLVRSVDKVFRNLTVRLPITPNREIDFEFMENFIAELEAERIAELAAYLTVSGLDNYILTDEEKKVLEKFETIEFNEYNLVDIFDVKNTSNILSRDIVKDSGSTPYLCASAENNAVSSYITYDEQYLEKGNCIFIGGKTFVVSYQKNDFYSNDSHNLALYLKESKPDKLNQLYLVTCIYKSLCDKYFWGDSVSKSKIKTDKIFLPTLNGKPDFENMDVFIKAIEKLVIKNVVDFADRKISATKDVVKA